MVCKVPFHLGAASSPSLRSVMLLDDLLAGWRAGGRDGESLKRRWSGVGLRVLEGGSRWPCCACHESRMKWHDWVDERRCGSRVKGRNRSSSARRSSDRSTRLSCKYSDRVKSTEVDHGKSVKQRGYKHEDYSTAIKRQREVERKEVWKGSFE